MKEPPYYAELKYACINNNIDMFENNNIGINEYFDYAFDIACNCNLLYSIIRVIECAEKYNYKINIHIYLSIATYNFDTCGVKEYDTIIKYYSYLISNKRIHNKYCKYIINNTHTCWSHSSISIYNCCYMIVII